MILVTGSTGGFGSTAIRSLLRSTEARNIAALARNMERAQSLKDLGVNVIEGNYDDYDSLLKAFKGIGKLLFVSGSEVEKRDRQHENIVRAAKEASIGHIVYTSFERKNDDPDSPVAGITKTHIETEKMIIESGIPYTFMRNSIYAEGLPMFLGRDVASKGIFLPAGNGRVPYALRSEMAEAAAIVIQAEGYKNKSYRIVNSHNYSFYEVAAILSEITGREIKYFCPSPGEYTDAMTKAGMPSQMITAMTGWFEGIAHGYFECTHSDLGTILGRQPADLKTILARLY